MAAMYGEQFNVDDADSLAIDSIEDFQNMDFESLEHEYELINKDLFEDFDLNSYLSGSKEFDLKKLPKRSDLNAAVIEKWVNEKGLAELRVNARRLKGQDNSLSGMGFGGKFFTYVFAAEPNSNQLKHAISEARNNINDFRVAVHTLLERAGSREDSTAKTIDMLVDKYDPLTEDDREFKRRIDKEEDQRRKKLGIADLYEEILQKVKIIKGDVKDSEIQQTYKDVRKAIQEARSRYEIAQGQIRQTNEKLLETNKKAAELERNIQKYMKEHKQVNKDLTRELDKTKARVVKLKEKVKKEHAKIDEAKKAMRVQFRELNKAQKMKQYQLSLIKQIKRMAKRKTVDYQYKRAIRLLTEQFDFTVKGPRAKTWFDKEREAILGFLKANPSFNDSGFEEYSKLYAQDFSIEELEGLKNEIQELITEGAWIYEQKEAEKKRRKEEKIGKVQDVLLDSLAKKRKMTEQEILEEMQTKPKGDNRKNIGQTLSSESPTSDSERFRREMLQPNKPFRTSVLLRTNCFKTYSLSVILI